MPNGERKLWSTVLLTQMNIILGNTKEREYAVRWVGSYPSKDFQEVCTLAGFDPDFIWPKMKEFCDMPVQERTKVKAMLVKNASYGKD